MKSILAIAFLFALWTAPRLLGRRAKPETDKVQRLREAGLL